MDEKLIAYFAGLFDGEGCVQLRKPYQTSNCIMFECSICMTDRAPLKLLHDHFGGCLLERKMRPNTNFIQYEWKVRSRLALNFAKLISPFSIVKKAQLDLGIYFQENKVYNKRNLLPFEIAEREILAQQMKNLKKVKV